MTEYNEGDLVEVSKGDEQVQGRITVRDEIPKFSSIGRVYYPRDLERQGYIVTVLEKSEPKPPQEAGLYVDRVGDFWVQGDRGFIALSSFRGSARVPAAYAEEIDGEWERWAPFRQVEV